MGTLKLDRRKKNQKGKEDEEEKIEKGKEGRRWPIMNRRGREGRETKVDRTPVLLEAGDPMCSHAGSPVLS